MSFNPTDLTVLAYADGHTYWHYITDDKKEDVLKTGYFEDARDLFRNNDMIELFAADGSLEEVRITTVGRVRLRT